MRIQLAAFAALLVAAACLPATASLPAYPANATTPIQNLVAVLTDFGTDDYYAGALEGSIYGANPSVRISTITHQVRPFSIADGSYILAKAAWRYPSGTVFMAEVDPGSDESRRFIVLETTDGKIFVGPDNGIFTGVMDELGLARVFQITNTTLMNQGQKSATFRAFSISGPVAARLAGGTPIDSVGPMITDPIRLSIARPKRNGSQISGTIVHIDSYGNLLTNIPGKLAGEAGIHTGDPLGISLANKDYNATYAITYSDVDNGEWLAMNDPEGLIEVARNMENAAATANVSSGETISLSLIS